jgi:hypothetical protein
LRALLSIKNILKEFTKNKIDIIMMESISQIAAIHIATMPCCKNTCLLSKCNNDVNRAGEIVYM